MAGYRHLEIVQDFEKYVKDKKVSSKAYYRYFLTRVLRMFQYKNLPDTIPHEILDRYLFEFGIACITKVDGKLYVFSGNLGGPQDVYYRPTEFIISNPHIKTSDGQLFTANVPVFTDFTSDDLGQPQSQMGDEPIRQPGVLMRNDADWIGLHPLISRYAYLMAENALTLRTADVMLRIIALISAPTDAEQASALEYLKSLEKGEMGVVGESDFSEGVKLQSPPSNNGSYLTQFIEYQQYLKGSFYNEIGLSANYNMKREAIGKGESTLDEDALLPLCDNMLRTRKEDIAKVNELYGTDISVEFSSAWLENRIEALSSLKTMAGGSNGSNFAGGVNPGNQAPISLTKDGVNPVESGESSESSKSTETPDDRLSSSNLVQYGVELGNRGTETTEETQESEELKESEAMEPEGENGESDSKINDISVDEQLTKLLENAEKNEDVTTGVNPDGSNEEGDDDSDSTKPEESTEDKGDNSEN